MVKIYTRFQTKTAQKPYPFGAAHADVADIGEYPPPGGGGKISFDAQLKTALFTSVLLYLINGGILLLTPACGRRCKKKR